MVYLVFPIHILYYLHATYDKEEIYNGHETSQRLRYRI
nr:MAG TPA: hypothetical protein [Caudoviricetes sp.]